MGSIVEMAAFFFFFFPRNRGRNGKFAMMLDLESRSKKSHVENLFALDIYHFHNFSSDFR